MPVALSAVSGDVLVSATTAGSQVWPISLALPGGGYVVLYASDKDGQNTLYLQQMNASGGRVGGEVMVSTDNGSGSAYAGGPFAAVVLNDGTVAICWNVTNAAPVLNTCWIGVVNPDGTPAGSPFGIKPVVIYDAQPVGASDLIINGLFTATPNSGVLVRMTNPGGGFSAVNFLTGGPAAGEILADGSYLAINTVAGTMSGNIVNSTTLAAMSSGLAISAGTPVVGNIDIVQLAGGNIVVTWVDQSTSSLSYRLFDSTMTPLTGDLTATASGSPDHPTVTALSGGGFVIAWSGSDGSGVGVQAEVFGASGNVASSVFTINNATSGDQHIPYTHGVTQLANGDLVFSWWEDGSTSGDVYTRVFTLGAPPVTSIDGTPGNDSLNGTAGDNTINGLGGNDKLYGNDGNDSLNGGDGADYLYGGAGTDHLDGGTGNDLLDGGAGADTMAGGAGNDIYYVDDRADVVTENPNEGYDIVRSTISWTLGDNFEGLQLLGSDNLNGTGNALANNLQGNSGANTLHGLDGNDTIDGGDGNDKLYGDAGNDILSGGAGLDMLDGGDDNDTLDGGDGADKLYGGNGNDTLLGGAGADLLSGDAGNDTLSGGDGNDTLDGGTGSDAMAGGAGNDIYYVDNKYDTATEALNEGYDIVRSSVTWTLGDNFEGLELQGSANLGGTGNALANTLQGNSGDNTLSGLAGADTINAGDGADRIIGGTGNDILSGGNGADTFVVLQESVGAATLEVDTILDFSTAQGDKLDLSAIDADSTTAGDQAFTLVSSFGHHAGEMTLAYNGSVTVLNLDVNGDGVSDYQVKINGDVHNDSAGWVL